MSALTVAHIPLSIPSGSYDVNDDEIILNTEITYVSNGFIKVGFYRQFGGAIGYLSEANSDVNLVCDVDLGKLIQQSYYANWLASDGGSKTFYAWNPIQGSAAKGASDGINAFDIDVDAGTIYINLTPGLWNNGTVPACTFEQWITFDGPVLTIRYRFNYTGTEDRTLYQGSGASSIFAAEGPAAFFTAAISNFVTYTGASPWTNDTLNRSLTGNQALPTLPTERWGARVNSSDYGVGIYDLSGDSNLWYISGGSNYAYVGADINWLGGLHVGDSKEFTRAFTVGNLSDIRQRFYNIHQPPPPLQKRPLKSSTGHGRISGKGGGRVSGKPS